MADSLMGTLRFRATDALSETEIRLVRVKLLREGTVQRPSRCSSALPYRGLLLAYRSVVLLQILTGMGW